jgi:hypothetical protein
VAGLSALLSPKVAAQAAAVAAGGGVIGPAGGGSSMGRVGSTPGGPNAAALGMSPKASEPEISIQHSSQFNYWLVTIKCRDRNKLFFDTVCTISDMRYDVYHGTIDSEAEVAQQLYYVRPR